MEATANFFQQGQRRLGRLAHFTSLIAEQPARIAQAAGNLIGNGRHFLHPGAQGFIHSAAFLHRVAGRINQRRGLTFRHILHRLMLFGQLQRKGAQSLSIRRKTFANGDGITGGLIRYTIQFRRFML